MAIIKTLCYFTIFEYPLTLDQIRKYLHGFRASCTQVKKVLENTSIINSHGRYYFFADKKKDVFLRIKRKRVSVKLLQEAKKIAKQLCFIPTIKLIGVSGSLSMNNCKSNDDIDLFIITRKHSLWFSRVFVVGLIWFLGKKRSRYNGFSKGKVCTNMWMGDENLQVTKKNIYTAHELAQLKVLVNKGSTYQKLLFNNQWIYRYLPNLESFAMPGKKKQISCVLESLLCPADIVCFYLQRIYMKRKSAKRQELLNRNLAMFHPNDCTKNVLREYKREVAKRIRNTSDHASNVAVTGSITNNFSFKLITPGS